MPTKLQNRFSLIQSEDEQEAVINAIDPAQRLTRPSAIEFNSADVRKPLASAVKMVKAKNRVILDEAGSLVQNKEAGEYMEVRIEDEAFVFDIEFDNGGFGTVVLDSESTCGPRTS